MTLEKHVRDRLGCRCEITAAEFHRVTVSLPERSFYVSLDDDSDDRLVELTDYHNDAFVVPLPHRLPLLTEEWPAYPPGPCMSTVVLAASRYGATYQIPVTMPAPKRHDRRGRWKRCAPSRRRHMKSWHCAPDAVKLRYAPMLRRGRYPYGTDPNAWPAWARHPEHGRRLFVGAVEVVLAVRLFNLPNAPGEEHAHEIMEHLRLELTCRLALTERAPEPARLRAVLEQDAAKHGIRLSGVPWLP